MKIVTKHIKIKKKTGENKNIFLENEKIQNF